MLTKPEDVVYPYASILSAIAAEVIKDVLLYAKDSLDNCRELAASSDTVSPETAIALALTEIPVPPTTSKVAVDVPPPVSPAPATTLVTVPLVPLDILTTEPPCLVHNSLSV